MEEIGDNFNKVYLQNQWNELITSSIHSKIIVLEKKCALYILCQTFFKNYVNQSSLKNLTAQNNKSTTKTKFISTEKPIIKVMH